MLRPSIMLLSLSSALTLAGVALVHKDLKRAAELERLLAGLDGPFPPLTPQDLANLDSIPIIFGEAPTMQRR